MAVSRRRGRSAGESTAGEIRSTALDLFYKHGFQATTLRHIAARVGIQVGSLYNHITSKGELLFEIMETVMLDLLEDQRQVAETPDVVAAEQRFAALSPRTRRTWLRTHYLLLREGRVRLEEIP